MIEFAHADSGAVAGALGHQGRRGAPEVGRVDQFGDVSRGEPGNHLLARSFAFQKQATVFRINQELTQRELLPFWRA